MCPNGATGPSAAGLNNTHCKLIPAFDRYYGYDQHNRQADYYFRVGFKKNYPQVFKRLIQQGIFCLRNYLFG